MTQQVEPNGNPGRTSDAELEERVELVRTLLCSRYPKYKIKRLLKERYDVCPRTVENYLARARRELVEATGQGKDEHVADAYAFYLSILENRETATRDKLKAQERMDKLLGLEMPQKFAATDTRGNDLNADERRSRIAEIVDVLRQRSRIEGDRKPVDERGNGNGRGVVS